MTATRRALLIAVLVVLIGALAWEFVPVQVTVWDGGFDLTVRVSSTAVALRSVSCEAFAHRGDAEEALENHLPPRTRLWSAVADPFTGEPLRVTVPVSGHESPSGREISRFQFRHLVVIGQLPDGRRVGKLVEIPDCRESREVSVTLP
jgi:hypothetical protein